MVLQLKNLSCFIVLPEDPARKHQCIHEDANEGERNKVAATAEITTSDGSAIIKDPAVIQIMPLEETVRDADREPLACAHARILECAVEKTLQHEPVNVCMECRV